ncbi:unnamed protein product [Polarella glacialis]|uniref:Uncharacterized protein n=1 Tax=Polarella glacialis TaxID=89957 RepID=A0A813HQE2_POLGL|nr:unnamed protein product [Polarella glacialis]
MVLSRVALQVPESVMVRRRCFFYKQANWNGLNFELSRVNWSTLLPDDSDAAAQILTDTILARARRRIPYKEMPLFKSTHPWLNDRCKQLVAAKCAAAGTTAFAVKQAECSQGIFQEHAAYIARAKNKIQSLPSSSKRRWKLSDALLMKRANASSIPPLRHHDGSLVLTAAEKARLFSEVFAAKSDLPEMLPMSLLPSPPLPLLVV